MAEAKLKRTTWRGAILLEGTEPLMVKVSQASENQLELTSPNALPIEVVMRFYLDVLDASRKNHEYIPMKVKVTESILVASAYHFRSKVKITLIDAKPLEMLKTALDAMN